MNNYNCCFYNCCFYNCCQCLCTTTTASDGGVSTTTSSCSYSMCYDFIKSGNPITIGPHIQPIITQEPTKIKSNVSESESKN